MAIKFKPGRIYRKPAANIPRMRRFWLDSAPPPPSTFDVNAHVLAVTGLTIAPAMDDNDDLSCCVEAAECKFLRRYYALQTGALIDISPQQVSSNYFAQTGGPDIGLIPDDSLAWWASNGQLVGNPPYTDKIAGSARVDATDSLDVHRAIYKLYGILVGGMIPECWVNQSAPWQLSDVLNGPIAGGHEMWCYSYDEIADTYMVETWDRQQVITGAAFRYVFAEANQGEASAIVPDPESAAPIDGFNIAAAQAELQQDREAA